MFFFLSLLIPRLHVFDFKSGKEEINEELSGSQPSTKPSRRETHDRRGFIVFISQKVGVLLLVGASKLALDRFENLQK